MRTTLFISCMCLVIQTAVVKGEVLNFKNLTAGVVRVWVMPHGEDRRFLRPPAVVFPQDVERVFVGESFPAYLVVRDQRGNDDHLGWYERIRDHAGVPEFVYEYKSVFQTRSQQYQVFDWNTNRWRTVVRDRPVRVWVPAFSTKGLQRVPEHNRENHEAPRRFNESTWDLPKPDSQGQNGHGFLERQELDSRARGHHD